MFSIRRSLSHYIILIYLWVSYYDIKQFVCSNQVINRYWNKHIYQQNNFSSEKQTSSEKTGIELQINNGIYFCVIAWSGQSKNTLESSSSWAVLRGMNALMVYVICHLLRSEKREKRTKNKELRNKNREIRTENEDLRTKNWKWRTEN